MSNFGPDDARTAIAAARRGKDRQAAATAPARRRAARAANSIDSSAAPSNLRSFNQAPANTIQELGQYDWNGTWYAIQPQEHHFLQGRRCRGVPVHIWNTIRNHGGILVEETQSRAKAQVAAKKAESRAHAENTANLRREAATQVKVARRAASVAASSTRASSLTSLASTRLASMAAQQNGAPERQQAFGHSSSARTMATSIPHSTVSNGMGERLRAMAERPIAGSASHQGFSGAGQANSHAQVMLYDKEGNSAGAWPLSRLLGLHDQSTCGVEGFVSHKMYKPPTTNAAEPLGLNAYRQYLVKRNRYLLEKAGCSEETREEVIGRAKESDNLSWEAVLGMAKGMAGPRLTQTIGLHASPAEVLEKVEMSEDRELEEEAGSIKEEDEDEYH